LQDKSARIPVLRIRDDELDFDESIIYHYKGRRFTGSAYDDMPGGGISEVSYENGVQQGPARDWLPSGKLKGESFFRRNVLHGCAKEFREDGSLISEKNYEWGILVSSAEYDEAGSVAASFDLPEEGEAYVNLQRMRSLYGE
jgi:antitoxin component YwqK of YwqJK toxin-antitoxin module